MNYRKMRVALDEAFRAYSMGEVPVGAAIFIEDELISSAHNMKESLQCATAHAEILAINQACEKLRSWRLNDASLYVTAEPCFMCSGAILQARISFVYYGINEPKFGGISSKANLFDIKTNHKVTYCGGICQEEITELMRSFFKNIRN